MKIINLFGLYPHDMMDDLSSNTKTKMDFAANNLQEAMIKGYKETGADYHIINAPFIGSWPLYYKKTHVNGYINAEERIHSVRFLNVAIIKRWDMLRKVKKTLFEYLNENPIEPTVVLFYNFNYIKLAKKIKEKFHHVKTCLLVTDLPEFMSSNSRDMVSRINKFITTESTSYSNYIDGYVLLAERMKERLPVDDTPYHIMEGIYNHDDSCLEASKKDKKIILYTGNMDPRYGINDLVAAFSLIKDPNIELWFRGDGASVSLVKERSVSDQRIKLIDRLSHKELLSLERNATLLVNPVHSTEEFTNYFFPSKTMEYLASGTPTLMCKLNCLPLEYREYIYFFEKEDVSSMARTILELCNKPLEELNNFGLKAREFIISKKTPKCQIAELLNFLKRL